MKKIILILLCLLLVPAVQALSIYNMMTVVNQYAGHMDWIRSTNQSSESFIFGNITLLDSIGGNINMGGNSIYNAIWINATNFNGTNLYMSNLKTNLDGTGYNLTINKIDTGQGMNELYDMDQNVLAASDVIFHNMIASGNISGDQNWTDNQNYPAACPPNTYISQLNDSVTCTAITQIDNDLYVDGNVNITGNFTGNQIYGEMWYHNHTATP